MSISPYLSLVAAEAGVGAGERAAAGVSTAMAGSSSEAGLSLTWSWGAGAENRPDTLKLMSANTRAPVLAHRASASLCRSARARITSSVPCPCLDHVCLPIPTRASQQLPIPPSRSCHPHSTDKKPRLRV